jgi:crotonobetainyl-CoA:carnitine CoA-transferase CaiB-like acyl-CoA transferase
VLQPGGTQARPSPWYGEHSEEVLSEQGYDEARIEALRAAGAFGAREDR